MQLHQTCKQSDVFSLRDQSGQDQFIPDSAENSTDDGEDIVSVEDTVDAFYPLWSFPPKDCPFDSKAYLDFALTIADLHRVHDGKTELAIPSKDIYETITDETYTLINDFDRKLQGLRRTGNLPSSPDRFTIDHVKFKGFVFTVGDLLHKAWIADSRIANGRPEILDIADKFFATGDLELLDTLIFNNQPTTARQGQPSRQEPDGPGADATAAATAVGSRNFSGESGQNQGLQRSDRYSVKEFHHTFVRESGLSVDKEGSLSELKPLTPWLDVPKFTAELTLDRYPALKDNPGHRALFQNIMMGRHNERGNGQGVFIKWELIAQHYGLKPWEIDKELSFNTGDLIRWFCIDMGVDMDEVVIEAIHQKGLARTITRDWIDDDVYLAWKEAMLDPYTKRDWINWINGRKVGTRTASKTRERERRDEIMAQEPTITPSDQLKEMRDYMNGRSQKLFSRKGSGVFCEENLQPAIDVAKDITNEEVSDGQLRALYTIRAHPQPLYLYCDRFPRLKSDHWNQAINLKREIRSALYTGRDVELDLAKAHLSGFIPVARKLGYDMPMLREHLECSLVGDIDLWTDIASYMDDEMLPDAKARRKAAKKTYALVYGSSVNNYKYQMLKAYANAACTEMTTQDAVEDVTDHRVIEEILAVREEIQAQINADDGLEDAHGRFVSLSAWDDVKRKDDRWRGVLAYTNCSYEQELISAIFDVAIQEEESDGRPRFQIWLLQGDGLTIRLARPRYREDVVRELQRAVKARADELGMSTALEVA